MNTIFTWPPSAATVLLFWPILSGLISLVYGYLDGMPRVHAVLSLFVKAGLDLPGILDAVHRFLTGLTPAQKAAMAKVAAVLLVFGVVLSTSACTPAQTAVLSNIEQRVLSDLEAGDGLPQIEGDVQAIVVAQGGAAAVVVEVTDAALALLADLGLIPPGLLPTATAYRTQLAAAKGAK